MTGNAINVPIHLRSSPGKQQVKSNKKMTGKVSIKQDGYQSEIDVPVHEHDVAMMVYVALHDMLVDNGYIDGVGGECSVTIDAGKGFLAGSNHGIDEYEAPFSLKDGKKLLAIGTVKATFDQVNEFPRHGDSLVVDWKARVAMDMLASKQEIESRCSGK